MMEDEFEEEDIEVPDETEGINDMEQVKLPEISKSPVKLVSRKTTFVSPIQEFPAEEEARASRAASRNLSRASFKAASRRHTLQRQSIVHVESPKPFDIDDDYDFDSDDEVPHREKPNSSMEFCRNVYRDTCARLNCIPVKKVLQQFGQSLFSLKDLRLSSKELKAIFVALVHDTEITDIDLSGNHLTVKEINYLTEILKINKAVSTLILHSCKLSGAPLKVLSDFISATNTLRKLDLSYNGLNDKDAPRIAKILERNESISELILAHNELGDGGIIIGAALMANDMVATIDLSWNHIRGHGAIGIGRGLEKNHGIKNAILAWNGFGFEGSVAIAHALCHNTTLSKLDLSCNRIHPPAMFELIRGIAINKTLSVIRLALNPITAPMTSIILQRILQAKQCGLKELDIEGIVVDKDFIPTLEKLQEDRIFMARYDIALPLNKGQVKQIDPNNIFNIDPIRILFFMKEHLRTIDLFLKLDKDSSNSLSRDEIQFAFEMEGYPISSAALDTVMGYLDTNRDGEIDLLVSYLERSIAEINEILPKKYRELIEGERKMKRKVISEKQEKKEREIRGEQTNDELVEANKYSQTFEKTVKSPRLPKIKNV